MVANEEIKRGSLIKTSFGRLLVVNKHYNKETGVTQLEGYEIAGNKKGYKVANFITRNVKDIEVFDTQFEQN